MKIRTTIVSVTLGVAVLVSLASPVVADLRHAPAPGSALPCERAARVPCPVAGPNRPAPPTLPGPEATAITPGQAIAAGRLAVKYGPDLGRAVGWVYCKAKGPNCGGATK